MTEAINEATSEATPDPMSTSSERAARAARAARRHSLGDMLLNRVQKNDRKLSRWRKREAITCYRLYDRDIPELPLTIDRYDDRLYVAVWSRKRDRSDPDAAHLQYVWLAQHVGAALGVAPEHVHIKERERQRGAQQYTQVDKQRRRFEVREAGLRFEVNLSDYLDTGLFLDHRQTRAMLRAESAGTEMLNLFAYTGSFSAYAAAGGAVTTTTVDLSQTYCEWARTNLALNGFNELAARPPARLAVPGRRWLAAVVVGLVGLVGCGGGRTRPRSLNARCGDGEGAACVRLGVRLEDGGDDLPDPAAAERAFGRACALREMAGCWHQGALLRLRRGDGDAARRARGLFRRACRAGAAMGCLYLAEMRRLGEGGRRNLKAAISGYQKLCRRGLKVACGDLGVAQQVGSATEAQATFRKACTAGDQLACANLGVMLAKSGDLSAALPVLRRACARNEATACVQLAVLVQTGRAGATPNPARAAILYQRACKAGHEDGCSGLALLLFVGRGVPAKPRTAMRIWRAVCEAGHGPSCANLATAYRSGAKGVVAIDRKAAAAWAAKACGLGVRSACGPASATPAK